MFKKIFLNLNTRSSLKKAEVRNSISFNKAKHIGLIFSIQDLDKHKAVKTFIKQLEEKGKKVQVLTYLGKGKQNHEFLFDFFSDGDINFWGKLINKTALKFTDNNFDFLFHLDTERNDIIENILSKSKAKCRIGIMGNNSEFYELIIRPSALGSFDDIFQNILYYVSKITGDAK